MQILIIDNSVYIEDHLGNRLKVKDCLGNDESIVTARSLAKILETRSIRFRKSFSNGTFIKP